MPIQCPYGVASIVERPAHRWLVPERSQVPKFSIGSSFQTHSKAPAFGDCKTRRGHKSFLGKIEALTWNWSHMPYKFALEPPPRITLLFSCVYESLYLHQRWFVLSHSTSFVCVRLSPCVSLCWSLLWRMSWMLCPCVRSLIHTISVWFGFVCSFSESGNKRGTGTERRNACEPTTTTRW